MAVAPVTVPHSRSTARLVAGYAPVVDLRNDALVGVDAQLSAGVIDPLAALREVCGDIADWRAVGGVATRREFTATVSLGWRTLAAPDAPARIAAVANAAKVPVSAITLVVSTPDLLVGGDVTVDTLAALRSVGFGVALDRFAAAQGTVQLLGRLPVTQLRVDADVVHRLPDDRLAESTALALVSLAQSLDIVTVAEGVSSAEQLAKVQLLRFDRAFGAVVTGGVR